MKLILIKGSGVDPLIAGMRKIGDDYYIEESAPDDPFVIPLAIGNILQIVDASAHHSVEIQVKKMTTRDECEECNHFPVCKDELKINLEGACPFHECESVYAESKQERLTTDTSSPAGSLSGDGGRLFTGVVIARKKPVEIEAMLFNNENKNQVYSWALSIQQNVWPDWDNDGNPVLRIPTLEGEMICAFGDYLIKEPFPIDWRKLYPCKPDIFAQTYDIVEESK